MQGLELFRVGRKQIELPVLKIRTSVEFYCAWLKPIARKCISVMYYLSGFNLKISLSIFPPDKPYHGTFAIMVLPFVQFNFFFF
jgi:hypothetical protein